MTEAGTLEERQAEERRQKEEDRRARLHPMQVRAEDEYDLLKGPVKKALDRRKLGPRPENEIELKASQETDRLDDVGYRLADEEPNPGAEDGETPVWIAREQEWRSVFEQFILAIVLSESGGTRELAEIALEDYRNPGSGIEKIAKQSGHPVKLLRRILGRTRRILHLAETEAPLRT